MDIEAISDFLALAETRSFSRAAEARFVTQPAFSRRIQAFEAALGTTLFDRSATPVALTKMGERFLAYARNIAEILDKATDEVQAQLSAMADPVYIVMPPTLSVTFFPPWYRTLQRLISGLTIRVATQSGSRCVTDLRRGLSDLAIILVADEVPTCFDLDGILIRELGADRLMAVRAKIMAGNEDFLGYPKGSYMDSCAQRIIGGQSYQTVFESPSSDLLKAMALVGFGTAVLQESLIEDDLRQEFLIPINAKGGLACKILLLRAEKPLNVKAEAIWAHAA